jgi:hypothetical protein
LSLQAVTLLRVGKLKLERSGKKLTGLRRHDAMPRRRFGQRCRSGPCFLTHIKDMAASLGDAQK